MCKKAIMKFMKVFILSLMATTVCDSATIVVDGVSEWKNPIVHIGDSIIFRDEIHKYNLLYVFKNEKAFNLCNFTQSYLLTKPNSTFFTWYPSRPGLFYFSFDNGTHLPCKEGRKLAVKVYVSTQQSPLPPPVTPPPLPPPPPVISSAPISIPSTPIPGGSISSSPAYQWPDGSLEPTQAPTASSPDSMPLLPDKGGGFPFINSNPAVPLPTGEVDSATIHPLPISSAHENKMVGLLLVAAAAQMPLWFTIFLML